MEGSAERNEMERSTENHNMPGAPFSGAAAGRASVRMPQTSVREARIACSADKPFRLARPCFLLKEVRPSDASLQGKRASPNLTHAGFQRRGANLFKI